MKASKGESLPPQKVTKDNVLRKLKDFNARANEMFQLSFTSKLSGSGWTLTAKQGQPVQVELRGPDDEAIKALCNDLRKFVQKGDPLCVYNLQPYFDSPFADHEDKENYSASLRFLSDFEADSMITVKINGERLTNRRVLEVFLYGTVSHRTEDKAEVHDRWEMMGPAYSMLKNDFVMILEAYLQLIGNFVKSNRRVIERLEAL